MSQTASTVPPGWQVAAEVDSRLEADLAVRMLADRNVTAVAVERGPADFAVYVRDDDQDAAGAILNIN